MRLGKDIVGKWIVTTNEGRQMGKVKDLLLDADLSQLNGIYLTREGMIRRKTIYIPRESVVVYGVDAVLIESQESQTDSRTNPIDDWVRLSKIEGRPIDTPGGTKLATLGDIILNAEGKITGFSLSKVSVTGPIAQNKAIARPAVIDTGNIDGTMTIDLSIAESIGMPSEYSVYMTAAVQEMEEKAEQTEELVEKVEENMSDLADSAGETEQDVAKPVDDTVESSGETADSLLEPPESLKTSD
ncbi:MAG: PRC-barrel domain-containing protein [Chloroflexota bacterium]